MPSTSRLLRILRQWKTLLGTEASIGGEDPGRELWPVVATDGRQYFLKQLSPWRNLPLADEARVLGWLSRRGIVVAEFLITDGASVFGVDGEESFILMPRLDLDDLDSAETLEAEGVAGRAVAELHAGLAGYPWSVDSYTEQLSVSLRDELLLPPDVADLFAQRVGSITAGIDALPTQLVHGDLTPENVLLQKGGSVAGFIDFDHLPLAPRTWDVARYLSRRLRLRWRGGRVPDQDRARHIEPFLRGYQHSSPLTGAEIDALPGLILAGNIIEANYGQQISSGRLERRKLPDHDQTLADSIDASRWQLTHGQLVRDAVQAATG